MLNILKLSKIMLLLSASENAMHCVRAISNKLSLSLSLNANRVGDELQDRSNFDQLDHMDGIQVNVDPVEEETVFPHRENDCDHTNV